MPFWENMATGSGQQGPIIRRYKTAVDKLRLLCGEKEILPIWPGRVVAGMGYRRGVVLADESSMGRYVYQHDVVSPKCGKVTLQIFSAKDPDHPVERVLDDTMVTRIWQDFEPYAKFRLSSQCSAPQ